MIKPLMLTTVDNPYNPFVQFDEWFAFDSQKGYNSCGLLARFARTSYDLSDQDNIEATNDAIIRIVLMNPEIYKIVEDSKGVSDREGGLENDIPPMDRAGL